MIELEYYTCMADCGAGIQVTAYYSIGWIRRVFPLSGADEDRPWWDILWPMLGTMAVCAEFRDGFSSAAPKP